jgi:hypothetical protein
MGEYRRMASPRPPTLRLGAGVALALVLLLLAPAYAAAQGTITITVAPALPQSALVGQTVAPSPGAWVAPETAVASYQWQRCNELGGACEPFGAVTPEPAAYTIAPTDAGRTLSVLLTVTAATETAPRASNAMWVPQAPSSTTPPLVEGIPRDGTLLQASLGGWSGSSPLAFSYQWQRCAPSGASCGTLAGATGASYLLSGADVGLTLRVQVTASNAAGMTAAQSAPTSVVAPAPLVNLGLPEIAGPAEVDRTLIAAPGRWTPPTGVEFLFRWLRCEANRSDCNPIPGATARTYGVRLADVGSRLRVRVTAIADAGSVIAESAQTAVVPALAGPQDFTQSGAPPAATPVGARFIQPFPRVRIKGFFTPRGARLELFTIKGSGGAQIQVICRSRSCPYRTRAIASRASVRLRSLERFHPAGTRFVVRITSAGLIGKYTRIVIRPGREPKRRDRCLLPGKTKPVRCPAGPA